VVSDQGWITMSREQAAIVRYEDNGKFSELYIPAGAVTRTTTISYTALGALPRPLPDDVDAAGRTFQLRIFEDGISTNSFVFAQPVCVVLEYDPVGLADVWERPLRLYHLAEQWRNAAANAPPYRSAVATSAGLTTETICTYASGNFALVQGPPVMRVYMPRLSR
jgi:hypothetical protein